jgi:hypothetical protein
MQTSRSSPSKIVSWVAGNFIGTDPDAPMSKFPNVPANQSVDPGASVTVGWLFSKWMISAVGANMRSGGPITGGPYPNRKEEKS